MIFQIGFGRYWKRICLVVQGLGGLDTKLHLAVDAHGLPVRVVVTEGTTADCTQASLLIEGLTAEYLLADKGYDSNEIIEQALA